MKITLLGTGTSTGVPIIGCNCEVCTSGNPKDKRMRSSVHVEIDGVSILIDTTPEFRLQALGNGIKKLDAVLYTHNHADHINGIDDLRMICFNTKSTLDCYGHPHTMRHLRESFRYIWEAEDLGGGLPRLILHDVERPFKISHKNIIPIPVTHGNNPAYGYRLGGFSYLPDVKSIPSDSFEIIKGSDLLIIDALRRKPHPTHLSLDESVEIAIKSGSKKTLFTHIAHSMGLHSEIEATLPESIRLAYDGLQIEI